MSTYLDKFRSVLPTVQGKQILDLLQDKKNKGEIKTIDEFKTKLNELTQVLLSQEITPTLKLFLGEPGQVIDSESYNEMLARIKDDLVAAFSEMNTIDEVLDSHQQIINQVILKSIQLGINELEEQIGLFEFINTNRLGLTQGQYNTFSTSKQLNTTRSHPLAGILFTGVESNEDAVVDALGERLLLSFDTNSFVTIHTARQIFDDETSASELDVSFKDSDISHIVDGLDNTYWIYNTLLSAPKIDGVVHKLELDLAATQDINFIEIEPASPYPVTLEAISYIKNNNDVGTIAINPITVKRGTKVQFPRVTANKLVLKFRQNNYIETQFEQKQVDDTFYNALLDNTVDVPVEKNPIADYYRDILTSSFLLEGILGIPRTPILGVTRKYYQYIIGFDHIRTGFSEYLERGIFVSKPLIVDNPGQIAIKTSETRPGEANSTISIDTVFDTTHFYHGSIEYSIIKENFDAAGNFIGLDRFNILPLGVGSIYHERLILTEKVDSSSVENAGFLRFYPASTTGDMKVYRNATLLVENTDWTKSSSGLTIINQTSPTSDSRMAKAIKITNPSISDIYTVTYTPVFSNSRDIPKSTSSLISIVSLGAKGAVRLTSAGVVTDLGRDSNIIAKSNIYLIIILRRNSAEAYLSPSVEEYTLLAGSHDPERFSDSLIK